LIGWFWEWPEGIWTGIAIVGMIYTWVNLTTYRFDLKVALGSKGNGLREARIIYARGMYTRARLRMAIFVIWFAMGCLYGFSNFRPPIPGFAAAVGFILTAVILAAAAYRERVDNVEMDELLNKLEAKVGHKV